MAALKRYTFRMYVEKYDITTEKDIYAESISEALRLVRNDILQVIKGVADKSGGKYKLEEQDFKVEIVNERAAHYKH